MAIPGNPHRGEPGFPPLSPTRPRTRIKPPPRAGRGFTPRQDDMPPMNQPLGIPGGMPPEIVLPARCEGGAWRAERAHLR